MSQWITDRFPYTDERYIYNAQGEVVPFSERKIGEPWKPVPKCEPYVEPKRYTFHDNEYARFKWVVWDVLRNDSVARDIVSREAAERIAAIYNEVLS